MTANYSEETNPFRPLALPLALSGGCSMALSMYLLFGSAKVIFANPGGNVILLVIAMFLFGFAVMLGIVAVKAWLRIPSRAIVKTGIGKNYSRDDLEAIILSQSSPTNKTGLTSVGKWLSRASNRFAALPIPYQRLIEVVVVTILFAMPTLFTTFFFFRIAAAADRPEIADMLFPAIRILLIAFYCAFWYQMLKYMMSAASVATVLSIGRIVALLSAVLAVEIAFSLFGQRVPQRWLSAVPDSSPLGKILFLGSVLILGACALIAYVRTRSTDIHPVDCSRIQRSSSMAAHPQTIVNAFRAILTQSRTGLYSEIGSWEVRMAEQRNTPGGTFEALLVGEYGAVPTRPLGTKLLHMSALVVGSIGILLITVSEWMLYLVPSADGMLRQGLIFLFLLVLGLLLLGVASYPLSEKIWQSWLFVFRVKGSFQSRGAVMMAASTQSASLGTFLIDYTLDGGVARIGSATFPNLFSSKVETSRIFVSSQPDATEAGQIEKTLQGHLDRAAASHGNFDQTILPR